MNRRLLNLLTLLSLLLCLAAAAMWLRGVWVFDTYLARHGSNLWLVSSYSDKVSVCCVAGAPDPGPPRWISGARSANLAFGPTLTRYVNLDPPPAEWKLLGVGGSHGMTRLGLLEDMTTLWVATGTV